MQPNGFRKHRGKDGNNTDERLGRESIAILSSLRNDVLSLPIYCYSNHHNG
jgi:hypothetical protein